jgi:hypothetical protein
MRGADDGIGQIITFQYLDPSNEFQLIVSYGAVVWGIYKND